MKNQGTITAARLGESAHASGTKVRNQGRDGCERRRIEVARDTLEGGALAHQRLLLTLSAGRRDGAPPDAAVPFRLVEKLAVRGRLPAVDLAAERRFRQRGRRGESRNHDGCERVRPVREPGSGSSPPGKN